MNQMQVMEFDEEMMQVEWYFQPNYELEDPNERLVDELIYGTGAEEEEEVNGGIQMKAVHKVSEEMATEKDDGVKEVIEAVSTVEMKAVHEESEEEAIGK